MSCEGLDVVKKVVWGVNYIDDECGVVGDSWDDVDDEDDGVEFVCVCIC